MKVDENGNILLPLDTLVDQLDDDGKLNLLGYLACDSTIVGWIVDQLVDGFFEPDEDNPSVYGWSGDSGELDKQRRRLDSKLDEVAKRRIFALQLEVDRAFGEGVSLAQYSISDELGVMDWHNGSEIWSRMCDATKKLKRKDKPEDR